MRYLYFILFTFVVSCQSSHRNVLRDPSPHHPTAKLAISTSEPLAAEAAAEIFRKGGNIADAAIAASFAIAVVRPQSTGIGGGGFLVSYDAKAEKPEAWDFRETAPYLAKRNMYLEKGEVVKGMSQLGPMSVATPGLVAGLFEYHQKHGNLKWSELLQPAIRLAGKPIKVSSHMARALKEVSDSILKNPEMAKIFTDDGHVLEEGDLFVQTDLQNTLKGIAAEGKKYFYHGDFAKKLGEWSKANQAVLNAGDLHMYQVKVRTPLRMKWRGYDVISMPPPSSGGVHLLQILNMVDLVRVRSGKYGTSKTVSPSLQIPYVKEIEAMKRAFADRAVWLGDPDYIHVPVEQLLSNSYMQRRADEIGRAKIAAANDVLPWVDPNASKAKREKSSEEHEDNSPVNKQTTHLSLMDSDGNAISTTQTLNNYFGANVMVPGTGVILNDEMDDFSVKPGAANFFGLVGGKYNEIAPGKRPLSSMTPTIVLNDKHEAILALGAPGGSRIISGVYYVLSRVLREGESIDQALAGCRFHHQWSPDKVTLEEPCFNENVNELKKIYPAVEQAKPFFFGEVQAVQRVKVEKDIDESAVSEGYAGDVLISGVVPRGEGKPMVIERPLVEQ